MCKTRAHPFRPLVVAAHALIGAGAAWGAPVEAPWPVDGPDDTACVAAAAYSGWYAAADSFENSVEIRDVRGGLRRTITGAEIGALLPWMSLGGGPDGPSALAFSPSGRLLFILVHDAAAASDGQPSDAVLRYDVSNNTVGVFARLEAFDRDDVSPHLAMVHHRGRLFVGTAGAGVRVYGATANQTAGSFQTTLTLPGGVSVRGLSVDRDLNTLFAAGETGVFRTDLGSLPSASFTTIAAGAEIRAVAWADHFGGSSPSQRGLYVLSGAAGMGRIDWLTAAQAYGGVPATPTLYLMGAADWHDLAATADGALLVGADEDARMVRDTADTRLDFETWVLDEFQQHVTFARGLISPDGEPGGWVIDGDVPPGGTRFHPATPDGAGWTVLALLMNDHLTADPTAQASVRSVLTRYAGLAFDGIRPLRSADGIYKHWIDPLTGTTEAGWPDEFATLSTMKIVAAAARAMAYYPDDPVIARAASRIIFRTRNWDAYLQGGTDALAFKGAAGGGPDASSFSRPFHEGIVFVDQAGAYGGAAADASAARWFNRALWPTATYVAGRPITSTSSGLFASAFISLYPALLSPGYRADTSAAGWRTQVQNVRWSNAAWTDDNAARFSTVFSAGTNPSGYDADSLTNHPANISTFTSLLAMSAFGETAEAVGGYAAYRKGARQGWKTGASLLYRRSNDSATASYSPNSAGLPDVTLGGLGLAELIVPGAIDAVLARPYPATEMCPVDLNSDGAVTIEDLYRHSAAPTDLNGDGSANGADAACMRAWLRRNEAAVSRP